MSQITPSSEAKASLEAVAQNGPYLLDFIQGGPILDSRCAICLWRSHIQEGKISLATLSHFHLSWQLVDISIFCVGHWTKCSTSVISEAYLVPPAKADRKKLKRKEVSNWPKVTDLISGGVKDSKLEAFNTEICCVPWRAFRGPLVMPSYTLCKIEKPQPYKLCKWMLYSPYWLPVLKTLHFIYLGFLESSLII